MWRYREVMPLLDTEAPVSLGEGWTPLFHAKRLGQTLGLDRVFVKDESLNPTNSFKARGLSAAVTRAKYLGARTLSIPTAGNAGNAMAAYAALAGIEAKVFMPRDVKRPFILECELYGADVTLVDGLITDAGKVAAERGGPLGWIDAVKRPRMVSVQAEHCAPIVRAFHAGAEKAAPWENAHTIADGLRVPRAIGDFLVLRAVRESRGTAIAVTDADMVTGMRDLGRWEGISAAPEGGAALHALRVLVRDRHVKPQDTVVVFNTGGALKYLDVLQ